MRLIFYYTLDSDACAELIKQSVDAVGAIEFLPDVVLEGLEGSPSEHGGGTHVRNILSWRNVRRFSDLHDVLLYVYCNTFTHRVYSCVIK